MARAGGMEGKGGRQLALCDQTKRCSDTPPPMAIRLPIDRDLRDW